MYFKHIKYIWLNLPVSNNSTRYMHPAVKGTVSLCLIKPCEIPGCVIHRASISLTIDFSFVLHSATSLFWSLIIFLREQVNWPIWLWNSPERALSFHVSRFPWSGTIKHVGSIFFLFQKKKKFILSIYMTHWKY